MLRLLGFGYHSLGEDQKFSKLHVAPKLRCPKKVSIINIFCHHFSRSLTKRNASHIIYCDAAGTLSINTHCLPTAARSFICNEIDIFRQLQIKSHQKTFQHEAIHIIYASYHLIIHNFIICLRK